jgi:hypothetical protein
MSGKRVVPLPMKYDATFSHDERPRKAFTILRLECALPEDANVDAWLEYVRRYDPGADQALLVREVYILNGPYRDADDALKSEAEDSEPVVP